MSKGKEGRSRCIDGGRMDGWIDGATDGRTDGRMDGWMDGWMSSIEQNRIEQNRMDQIGIEQNTLFNHCNFIKFTYVTNMENLFYLKAVMRTNNHYNSVHVNRITASCIHSLHNCCCRCKTTGLNSLFENTNRWQLLQTIWQCIPN